jgi:hypothetical protein
MAVDFSAIARWPNVPACHEWLSLDRRGDWRLQGERVTHRGLIEFMNRQYTSDAVGRWFVQNGPQRVFVDLAYTPWIFRREGESLSTHTGQAAGKVIAAYLDSEGSILLETETGIGLLDDRDLPAFLGECRDPHTGRVAEDAALIELMAGRMTDPPAWRGLPLQAIVPSAVAGRFGFDPQPRSAP